MENDWRKYLTECELEEINAFTTIAPHPGDSLATAIVKMIRLLDNQPPQLPKPCGCGNKTKVQKGTP